MYEIFPEYGKGDFFTAENANNLNKLARYYASTVPGANLFGMGHKVAGHERFHQRNVIVVSVRQVEDGDSDDADGESSASSSSSVVGEVDGEWPCEDASYRVRHQFFNQDTGLYVTDTDDNLYCLDGSGFGTFSVDDQLTAWWDAQRGMYRPAGTGASGEIAIGKTDLQVEIAAAVAVTRYDRYLGSETGETLEATNLTGHAIGADKWVILAYIGGFWNIISGPCLGVDEEQILTIFGSPTGGQFRVSRAGSPPWSDYIDYDASAGEFEDGLNTIDSLNGNVICTGGPLPNVGIRIQYTNELEHQNVSILMGDWSNLTGGVGVGIHVTVSQEGKADSQGP